MKQQITTKEASDMIAGAKANWSADLLDTTPVLLTEALNRLDAAEVAEQINEWRGPGSAWEVFEEIVRGIL